MKIEQERQTFTYPLNTLGMALALTLLSGTAEAGEWSLGGNLLAGQNPYLVGGLGLSRLGEGIADSPIVEDRTLGGSYLGLVYRF